MGDAVEAFTVACRTVISCWTALNLAVENGWGGDNSQEKRSDLMQLVTDFCLSKKELYTDEVEDLLFERMQSLFFVDIEDESEVEIARILVQLHNSCSKGDVSFAQELCQKLTKCDSSLCRLKDNVVEASSDESDDMEEVDAEGKPKQGNTHDSRITRNRQPKTEQLEDGWTKVL